MRITTGKVLVTDDVKRALDKKSISEAVAKHRRADPGIDTGLKQTLSNHPIFGKPTGFQSGHVAKNGREFAVITDYGTKPHQTVVTLRRK